MASIYKILRSIVAGNRPATDATKAGTPFVNYADKQFGVMDVTGVPVDLMAVRQHSATAKYVANDTVIYAGNLYQAIATVGPSAFGAASWKKMTLWEHAATAGDIFYNDGNVGIGTDSPRGKLHVKTPTSPNALVVTTAGDIGVCTNAPSWSHFDVLSDKDYYCISARMVGAKGSAGFYHDIPNPTKVAAGEIEGISFGVYGEVSTKFIHFQPAGNGDCFLSPGGNVGIGYINTKIKPSEKLSVVGTGKFTGNVGIGAAPDATHKLVVAGGGKFTGNVISIRGVLTASDIRFKSDIADVPVDLNAFAAIPLKSYTMDGEQTTGIMAQDLEKQFPDAVVTKPLTPAWDASTTYDEGALVEHGGKEYSALSDVAVGIQPDDVWTPAVDDSPASGGWKPIGDAPLDAAGQVIHERKYISLGVLQAITVGAIGKLVEENKALKAQLAGIEARLAKLETKSAADNG